jgi:hypothetical protein
MLKPEGKNEDYLSDSPSLSSSLDEEDQIIKSTYSATKSLTQKYPLNINMMNPVPLQPESDSSPSSAGKGVFNFDQHLKVKNNESLRMI